MKRKVGGREGDHENCVGALNNLELSYLLWIYLLTLFIRLLLSFFFCKINVLEMFPFLFFLSFV